MKKCKSLISIMLALFLLLSALPLTASAAAVSSVGGAADTAVGAKTNITSVSVTGVTAPVDGNTPQFTASASGTGYKLNSSYSSLAGWKNGIKWEDESGGALTSSSKFVAGKQYTVKVMLDVTSSSYEFRDYSAVSAKLNGYTAKTNFWDSTTKTTRLIVIYTFTAQTSTKTNITSVSVTGVVAPVPGGSPQFTATASGTGYKLNSSYSSLAGWKNGIKWEDESGNALTSSSKFVLGKKYTVKVMIDVTSSAYEFRDYSTVSAKLNGYTAKTNFWDSTTKTTRLIVIYTFTAQKKVISEVKIVNVTTPVIGASPVYSGVAVSGTGCHIDTSLDSSIRINGVTWADITDNKLLSPSSVFAAGHAYSINVLISADTGYEFTGTSTSVKFGSYSADGNNKVSGRETTQTIATWYEFPVLTKTEISNVEATVTAPKAGAKPDYTVTLGGMGYYLDTSAGGSQIYNGVLWYDKTEHRNVAASETFAANHEYKVDVYIHASEDYRFKYDGYNSAVKGKINGAAAAVSQVYGKDPEQIVAIDYSFPVLTKTEISNVEVTVTAPKAGAKPDYTVTLGGTGYYSDSIAGSSQIYNGVQWYDKTDNRIIAASETFAANHEYKVDVYIHASEDYRFKYDGYNSAVKGKVNGAAAAVSQVYGKDPEQIVAIDYSFPVLEKTKVSSVTIKNVPAPAVGGSPVYSAFTVAETGCYIDSSLDSDTRINGITWYDVTDKKLMYPSDTFKAGHVYSINALISADTDYELTGKKTSVKFESTGADGTNEVYGREPSQTIAAWYYFPKLVNSTLIGDVNDDGVVNGADAGLLSRYAAGWKDYDKKIKNMAAADINGDGNVNGADAGILARYTSGWKNYDKYFSNN